MRAAVYRKNRGLVIEDVAMPEIGPQEVLVKVANTGFCGSDHSMLESGSIGDGIDFRGTRSAARLPKPERRLTTI